MGLPVGFGFRSPEDRLALCHPIPEADSDDSTVLTRCPVPAAAPHRRGSRSTPLVPDASTIFVRGLMTPIDRTAHRAPRRTMTVRTRLFVLAFVAIAALLGLVITNAVPAWDQQRSLRNDSTTGRLGGEASLPLFVGAQFERKLTAAYLADPTSAAKKALQEQRAKTDAGLASFRKLSGTELQTDQRHRWEYVEAVYTQLKSLPKVREQVDARTGDPDKATGYYTTLVNKMIAFYQALSAMDDGPLTLETRPLVGLFYASDALAQQDMLITQARDASTMTAAHRVAFAEAYGTQQVMYERWIAPYLPASEKTLYDKITSSKAWGQLQAAQRSVITPPTDDIGKEKIGDPAALARWDAAYGQVSGQIAALNLKRTQGLLAHGFQRADEIRTQVFIQGAVLLAAILAIAGLIVWLIRSISARLRQLRAQTEDGARRLPDVVNRLRRGEPVDAEVEFPEPTREDEFGHVAAALVGAQRTAVLQAANQAADRRGIGAFMSAATERTLGHIGQGLGHLEQVMNRQDVHPSLLEELVRIDGSVTAARRHQEHVGVLAGTIDHGAFYTEPKSLLDIVNDAAVETGSAERVDNQVTDTLYVSPEHVAGVVKVVAALLDNGLGKSNAQVVVRSRMAVHGAALEVEDAGFGMVPGAIEAANKSLTHHDPATFEAMASRKGRLGLFVVARLAGRHHLHVSLRPSPYRGITAIVLIGAAALIRDNHGGAAPQQHPATTPGSLTHPPAQAPTADPQGQLPRRRPTAPAPVPAADPADAHAERQRLHHGEQPFPAATDPHAAGLPQRRRGEHIPAVLRDGGQLPQPQAPATSDPQQVASQWGAFQDSAQQPQYQHPNQ
ncbi:nitrate- and nitrite sensing domain-containing protein [Actinacidiphila yeochonensis]|uniref:nitrate- and nitrite sensing domain-containing protein n=1 Tax=Actinacidiphila yeochonensis TaxID=89050 RepID=UPI00055EBA2A|nr:nitrate- and nitrite sensing domain-containing protein [Actinacidiphila yeochonensis]